MTAALEEHRAYATDRLRLDLYAQALREVVRPTTTVLDYGTGTALLGLLACRAGATHVQAIESGGIIELAREVVRANDQTERFTFLPGSARDVQASPVDLIVADQLGLFGFWPILHDFIDARRRFLKPGGRLMPSQVTVHAAAVESAEAYRRIDDWTTAGGELDMGPVRDAACNSSFSFRFDRQALVSEPFTIAALDLMTANADRFGGLNEVAVSRAGLVHGLAVWFSAQLSPSVTLTNSPLADASIAREHYFLPLQQPLSVQAGTVLAVSLDFAPELPIANWAVAPVGTTAPKQSLWKGLLLSRARLGLARPTHTPHLCRRGKIERFVLGRVDGQHSRAAIEEALLREHADLVTDRREAARLVNEILQRCARPDLLP